MKKVTSIIYSVFALLALGVCLTEARADCGDTGDIPFTVTLLHRIGNVGACMYVTQGFGGRVSSGLDVADLTPGQPCTFYAARKTIFPVTGFWDIEIYLGDLPCRKWIPVMQYPQRRSFQLKEDANRVDITLDRIRFIGEYDITVSINGVIQKKIGGEGFGETASAGGNTVEQPRASSPIELAAEARLGDSQDPSGRPDSDKWSFFGNAGDSITLRLEPDTTGGNNGGQATLRFVGPPTRQVTGALRPVFGQERWITVELGSTGRHEVAVEQADRQGTERYRGGYILTVESAKGTIHGLMPGDSVEQ